MFWHPYKIPGRLLNIPHEILVFSLLFQTFWMNFRIKLKTKLCVTIFQGKLTFENANQYNRNLKHIILNSRSKWQSVTIWSIVWTSLHSLYLSCLHQVFNSSDSCIILLRYLNCEIFFILLYLRSNFR